MSLKAEGHATGSEVVCGIVSAVVQGLATALRNATTLNIWAKEVHAEIAPGSAHVGCVGSDEAWTLFEFAYITLAQVATAEPKKIFVEICVSPVAIQQ